MTNAGYLIARNRAEDSFFTSASSYDRPRWTPLKEAKVYATAELADLAAKKLLRNGAYEARIVSLAEAMSFEFPDADDKTATLPNQEQDKKNGMVAAQQDSDSDSEEIKNDGTDPEEENGADLDSMVDDAAGISDPADRNSAAGADLAKRLSAGKGGLGESAGTKVYKVSVSHEDTDGNVATKHLNVKACTDADHARHIVTTKHTSGLKNAKISRVTEIKESATMPAKPPLDAKPDENDKTAIDGKKIEVIKYDNSSTPDAEDPEAKLFQTGALPNDAKVKVPAEVMADLSAAIATFDECAEYAKSQDDDKASFCMTVAEAFKSIQADFKLGTVAGIKSAQIKVTSWMNPITSHLPVSVQKFIYMGGRKPSLLDLFDQKRLAKAK